MKKIAVIGDYENICGFSALGLDIFGVSNQKEAEDTLKRLAEKDFAIIYIAENYIEKMPELFEKYKAQLIPAIIPIPSGNSTSGFGIKKVKQYVEQAVGSDIIFNDDK